MDTTATVLAIVAFGVVGILVAIGYAIGKAGNQKTITLPGDGKSAEDCAQASAAWDTARQMECNAKADEASARNRADAVRGQMGAFLALGATLSGIGTGLLVSAGLATATVFGVPLGAILLGIAIGILAAATLAFAYAAILAGELINADLDAAQKLAARDAWTTAITNARSEVNAKCTLAEANMTLSRTAPC